jgi:hypothetical protein
MPSRLDDLMQQSAIRRAGRRCPSRMMDRRSIPLQPKGLKIRRK